MKRVYLWLSLAVFIVIAGVTAYLGYLLWSKTNEKVIVNRNYPGVELSKINKFNEFEST
jgi:hypothetical protein